MDIEKIVSSCFPNGDAVKISDFKNWLIRVKKLCGKNDIQDELKRESFLLKTFYSINTSGVSRAQYQKYKEFLLRLALELKVEVNVPDRDAVLRSQEIVYYFKDLESLIGLIDKTGYDILGDKYNPDEYLLSVKAVVILGWAGLELGDMPLIQKQSIVSETKDGQRQYFVRAANGDYKISKPSYDILKSFASSSDYRNFPSGKIQRYVDNNSLFRPIRSDYATVPEKFIVDIIISFNKCAVNYGYSIANRHLKKNALFASIYENSELRGKIETIIGYFGTDTKTVIGFQKEYDKWKSMYHS